MDDPKSESPHRQENELNPNQLDPDVNYKAWYDFAPVGFFTLGEDDMILDANLTGASLLGIEREILTHQRLSQFVYSKDRAKFGSYCRRLSETDTILHIELGLVKKNGVQFCVRIAGQVAQESEGQGRQYRLVVNDITEHVLAQQALQVSEELHRVTLSSISDTVFITDEAGRFVYVCPNIDVIFGYSNQEVQQFGNVAKLLGTTVFDPKALETGSELLNIEREIRDKFGRRRVVLINVKRVTINAGTLLYTCHEITDRQRVEQALHQSEAFNRDVLNSLTAHIAVLDKEGDIIAVNEAWKRFAQDNGASLATEVGVGTNYLDVSHQATGPEASDAQAALTGIQDVLAGSLSEFALEYHCHSPFDKRWFLMKVTPLSAQNSGSVISHENITDRVRAETEKAKLFEAVSWQREQLRILSGQLAEAQEAERKALARELHDQVGQNLTALNLNLHYIRSQLNQVTPETVGQIQSRLDDSLTLVQQTTERTQDIMGELRPPVLDDYGLLSALRWYCDQFAKRVDFDITVEGEDPVPRLAATIEHALFRITQEALTNVAKHAQANRVVMRLETDNEFARLVITDDGSGFDLIHWADSTTRQSWGLLTMVERAEAVGGYCQIESQLGEGTRIMAEIPR